MLNKRNIVFQPHQMVIFKRAVGLFHFTTKPQHRLHSGRSTDSLFLLLPLSDKRHNSTASLSQSSICKPIAAALSGDVLKLPHQIQFLHTNEGSTLEIIISFLSRPGKEGFSWWVQTNTDTQHQSFLACHRATSKHPPQALNAECTFVYIELFSDVLVQYPLV